MVEFSKTMRILRRSVGVISLLLDVRLCITLMILSLRVVLKAKFNHSFDGRRAVVMVLDGARSAL